MSDPGSENKFVSDASQAGQKAQESQTVQAGQASQTNQAGQPPVSELSRPDLLVISDESATQYYGCDQDWFALHWQRQAGCGPCTAATLLYYLSEEAQEGKKAFMEKRRPNFRRR